MGFVCINLRWSLESLNLECFRGYEVYDRLSPSFAKYLETLEAVHEGRIFQQVADIRNIKLRDGEGKPHFDMK